MEIPIDQACEIEKAHYRCQLGMYFSGMKLIEGGKLLYSNIIDDYYWNYATNIKAPQGKEEDLINYIVTFYRRKMRQPSIYLTPFSRPHNMSNYLRTTGFKIGYKDAWMVYERGEPLIKKVSGLIIKEVITCKDMEIFIKIFYEAYGGTTGGEPYGGLPPTYGEALRRSFENPSNKIWIKHYLGLIDGKPAGIGTLISSNRFGGIYNVGTSSKYRKNGIGSAISLRAIEDSMKGGNTFTYLMTEAGSYVEEFYKKLGFSTIFIGCGYVFSKEKKR